MDRISAESSSVYSKSLLSSSPWLPFTLGSDGRSNIRNDPMTASMVITPRGNLPLGTDNAGSEKKTGHYVFALARKYSSVADPFGCRIFGLVQDGAAACIKALYLAEETSCLVPIRCQSHAVALELKNTLSKVFPDLLAKVQHVIGFVRGKPRVLALFQGRIESIERDSCCRDAI